MQEVNRVAKIQGGTGSNCSGGTYTKLYWRSLSGDSLAETDGSGSLLNTAYSEYVFFAGRRIASRVNVSSGANPNVSIFYYFADQLGSTRTITTGSGKNANGSSQTPGLLCYDQDYTPYGQEVFTTAQMSRLQTTACPPNYRFTGYEYDAETGLDYAFARYYSPRLGRFLSTDPLGGSVADLQSHNAYAYASNNPLNMIDPSGMNDCAHTSGDCGGITLDGEPIDTYGSWFGRSLLGYVNNGGGTAPCPTSDCTVIRIVQGGGGGTDIVQKLTWNDPTWSEHWGPDGSLTSLSLQIGYWSWKTTGYTDNTPVSWWVDFSQNVGSNLVHGVRNQGESFGSCVLRNASETTGGLHGVLVGAVVTTASAAIANASRVSVPWAGNASGGAGTVSGSAFIALTVARLVYYGSAGLVSGVGVIRPVATVIGAGGRAAPYVAAAEVGLLVGSAINCR